MRATATIVLALAACGACGSGEATQTTSAPLSCASYCTTIQMACGTDIQQYSDTEDCLASCKAFPFGAGAPGMTSRAVQWLKQMKPQALYGTPSYALFVAETARKEGVDPAEFGVKYLFFSGEPGASVPGVRDRIEDVLAYLFARGFCTRCSSRCGLLRVLLLISH